MRLTAAAAAAAAVVYEYASTERLRRVRFSWYLGPSPRQSIVVWPRGDPPPADCASGAKQRRQTAVPPSNLSIVLLLLAVMDDT